MSLFQPVVDILSTLYFLVLQFQEKTLKISERNKNSQIYAGVGRGGGWGGRGEPL